MRRPARVGAGALAATARSMLAMLAMLMLVTAPLGAALAQDSTDEQSVGAAPAAIGYPTVVIADYVLGCMAANGNSYIALQQCSCSIDYIAARMPYPDYERAGTVMQVQLDRGQRGLFYRDSSWAKRRVEQLENLQAQSTLECF